MAAAAPRRQCPYGSPNTGAGAHTALLDARALRYAFQQAHQRAPNEKAKMFEDALHVYNDDTVARAAKLLRASRRRASVRPFGFHSLSSESSSATFSSK